MTTRIIPNPEMLGRRDGANPAGQSWTVDECAPVRGEPHVIISQGRMVVPTRDEPVARVIRAHEMMHVKVSPADYGPYVARGMASLEALKAAEELRVNLLLRRAGFDPKLLADGGEEAEGEYVAEEGLWADAVYATVAYAITGSHKPFLNGVRRHNRAWGASLKAIAAKAEKLFGKADDLGSTRLNANGVPWGWLYTERVAEWLDRLATRPEPDGDGDDAASGSGSGDPGVDGQGDRKDRDAPLSVDQIKAISVDMTPIDWVPVVEERVPLPKTAPGGLGRKRRPAPMGRNPRRIHRMLTDPDRRIFDAPTRGNGGVVLIDASGSMSFSHADILAICAAAPGATVAMHACSGRVDNPNLWVLADRGRVVEEIPARPGGNGNDRPALDWAIARRQHPRAPVLWVTDGGVQGLHGSHSDGLALDCIKTALAADVLIAPNVDKAVEMLGQLAQGRRPRRWWPWIFTIAYERHNPGRTLPQ